MNCKGLGRVCVDDGVLSGGWVGRRHSERREGEDGGVRRLGMVVGVSWE